MQLSRRLFVVTGIGAGIVASMPFRCDGQQFGNISSAHEVALVTPPSELGVDMIQLPPLPGSVRNPVVTAMAFHPATNTLAAAGDDHAVRWIDLDTGKTLATLAGHIDWVRQLAFVNASNQKLELLSCGDDGRVYHWTWDFETSDPYVSRKLVLECDHTLYSMAFEPQQQLFAVGGFSHDIYVQKLQEVKSLQKYECECGDQRAFVFSADGQNLLVGGRDGAIHILDLARGEIAHEYRVHRGRLRSLALSSDGKILTSVGEDRFVNRIQWQTGEPVMSNHLFAGKLLAVEPIDEDQLAIASADNTVQVVNSATGEPIKKLIGHDGSVAVLLYEHSRLFTAGYDTTIRIWDLNNLGTQERETKLIRHTIPGKFLDSGISEKTY